MKIGLYFFFFIFPLLTFSQEVLLQENYSSNYQLHFEPFTPKKKSHKTQTLSLPFFDDFYQYSHTLNSNKWEENVNILVAFGVAPNTLNRGVAVLDGAQKNGQGYFETPTQGTYEKLLSQPIDLSSYDLSDSIYFSFAFMHGGYGDKAESSDSLKLYFIDKNLTPRLVWYKNGGDTMLYFQKINLPLDTLFFHPQFQFYFETFGNLNGLFDQWFIDYIFLDKNRNHQDTIFTDLSFSDARYSIFDSLTAIPLKQFQSKPWMSQKDIFVTNLSSNNEGRNLIWSIEEVQHNTALNPPLVQNQFFAFFPPQTEYPIPAFSEQTNVIQDYSLLKVQFSLNQNASDPQVHNDTLNLFFPIDTVWAYDDGFPETGYGLRTAKTFVQKFYATNQDTLKAVMINFVRNLDIIDGKGFKLVILSNLHKDSVLYSKFYNLTYYQTIDSFNYFLLDSLLPLPEVYYIGITQPDNKPIGVGFDFSYNNNANIYWDSSSVFVKSRLNGTLMIRPVMGSKPELSVSRDTYTNQLFKVYPNPFSDYLQIENQELIKSIELFDALGNFVQVIQPSTKINLEFLGEGVYLLKCTTEKTVWTQKIVKLP